MIQRATLQQGDGKMAANRRPTIAQGNGRAKAELLSRAKHRGASHDWRSRLSKDRPVYGCPKCTELAMQFYAEHPSHPDRAEFFHCHACGTCWEM